MLLSCCQPKLPIVFEIDLVATGLEDFTSYNDEYNFVEDNQYTNVLNARNEEHLVELLAKADTNLPEGMGDDTSTFIFTYGRKLASLSAIKKNGEDYILEVVFEEEYCENQVFVYAIPKTKVYPFRWSIYYLENSEKIYWGATVVEINQRK